MSSWSGFAILTLAFSFVLVAVALAMATEAQLAMLAAAAAVLLCVLAGGVSAFGTGRHPRARRRRAPGP